MHHLHVTSDDMRDKVRNIELRNNNIPLFDAIPFQTSRIDNMFYNEVPLIHKNSRISVVLSSRVQSTYM